MAVVVGLDGSVDEHHGLELLRRAPCIGGAHAHGGCFSGGSGEAGDRVSLLSRQPELCGALTLPVLQRQYTHADQVGTMDALVGLGNDGTHAEQQRALGGPVAR